LEQVIKELEEADRKKNAIVEDLLKDGPSRRANFSLNAHFEKDEIVMFGGEYFNGQKVENKIMIDFVILTDFIFILVDIYLW
jgi:hypothetical protein